MTAGLAAVFCCSCHTSAPLQPPDNLPDTTSHAFNWHKDIFGDGLSNDLWDVAVLNDTSAYAVGELYLRDSAGSLDPTPYNLATWNGTSWTLHRLYYHFQNDSATGTLYSILAFGNDDIWFASGNLIHWDGKSFQSLEITPPLFPSIAHKMWGTSDRDLYLIGNGGRIVHFDGSTWQLLQTGTTSDFTGIWGALDPASGRPQILAVASDDVSLKIVSIQGSDVTSIQESGLSPSAGPGVWFVPNQKYYVVGAGIGQKNSLSDVFWKVYQPGVVTSFASNAIRGRGTNDIFVAGSFMELVHFNGSSWYNYQNEIPHASGVLANLDMTRDLVMAVGSEGSNGVAYIGRRK